MQCVPSAAHHQSHGGNIGCYLHNGNHWLQTFVSLQVFLPAEAATALAAPSAAMHMLSTELLVYRRTIDQVTKRGSAPLLQCALQHMGPCALCSTLDWVLPAQGLPLMMLLQAL